MALRATLTPGKHTRRKHETASATKAAPPRSSGARSGWECDFLHIVAEGLGPSGWGNAQPKPPCRLPGKHTRPKHETASATKAPPPRSSGARSEWECDFLHMVAEALGPSGWGNAQPKPPGRLPGKRTPPEARDCFHYETRAAGFAEAGLLCVSFWSEAENNRITGRPATSSRKPWGSRVGFF